LLNESRGMQTATTSLKFPPPFSLKATALGHGWHECAPITWCEAAGCLQLVERVGDMPVRVSVVETSARRSAISLAIIIDARDVSDTTVTLMRNRVAIMLRHDTDLTEFYELAAEHEPIAPVIALGAGRILRSPSMAENIVKAICATNVNWTQAVKMINRIGQLGPSLPHFRSLNAWPTPREILSAGDDYLKNVARLGYRSQAVLEFCQSIVQREFDPDELDRMAVSADTDDIFRVLCGIKGVGPASAGFLLSQLGRHERMSIDSATVAFVGRKYFNGKKPTPKQIERVFNSFGRWKGLVWWFEQWLEWETARTMLRDVSNRPSRRS
jgi:3-methyladenine DNA glycosylase/8-oxoguanine DNA glycosylase